MTFKIGPYNLPNSLVLAPMAGITDGVFRDLCRAKGAGFTVAEMVASKESLRQSKKSSTRHVNRADPEPRAVQLVGTDPAELADAAAWQVSQGAQIIDINMGCPAKKVCSVAAGSALMAHPQKVATICQEVVQAVSVPVTLKIRTGHDANHKNALHIAQIAEQNGIQALAVHGRTRLDKFNGQAEYETTRQVKQAVTIPVIANGDINSPEKAAFVLKYTQADALMIGRAAQGYPWIFKEINHFLQSGQFLTGPSYADIEATLLAHLQGLYALYGEPLGVRIARKHLGWYTQNLTQGKRLRQRFNQVTTAHQQINLIKDFFAAQSFYQAVAV